MTDSTTAQENARTGKQSSRASDSKRSIVPVNLPALTTKLIGRDQDILAIQKLLAQDDVHLLTLTGLGGVGKTSLLLKVTTSLAADFPGGVYFVNLAPLINSELILIEIASILKIKLGHGKDVIEAIRSAVAGKCILLALDNFEHLMPGASQLNQLLLACPSLKMIITSREPLRLRAEQVYPVQPLDVEHAVELFTKRAQSQNPNFSLTSNDRASVAELCRRLDGLPLAIELAALRTRTFTPQSLLARLQPDLEPAPRILDLLSSGARDLPERHQSLRKTIEWSYSLLEPQEQFTLRVASIFPAGFTIPALATTLQADEVSVIQNVASLVDKNLVRPSQGSSDHQRFVMLEAIREYAWDEIKQLGEVESLQVSYISTYLALSEKAEVELRSEKQDQWIAVFNDEFMNVNLVLEMCLTFPQGSEMWKTGFRILGNFHYVFAVHGQFLFAEKYLARAQASIESYEKAGHDDDESVLGLKVNIYVLAGNLAWAMGNYREAASRHEAAFYIFENLDDEPGMAEALNNWAVNLGLSGDYQASLEKHEQGLALNRKSGNRWGEVRQLNNLGNALHIIGRDEEALAAFEQGLSIAREIKDVFSQSMIMSNLAYLKTQIGEYEAALSLLEAEQGTERTAETTYLRTWSLAISSRAHLHLGHLNTALREIIQGLENLKVVTDTMLRIEFLVVTIDILIHLAYAADAAQLIGALSNIRSDFGIPNYPVDRESTQKQVEQIRSMLSVDSFIEAERKGQNHTLDSALSFANQKLKAIILKKDETDSVLTEREREVIALLARGLTNEEIAKELVVVVKTVEKHVANILMKLGVKNRTEATAWAIDSGHVKQNVE